MRYMKKTRDYFLISLVCIAAILVTGCTNSGSISTPVTTPAPTTGAVVVNVSTVTTVQTAALASLVTTPTVTVTSVKNAPPQKTSTQISESILNARIRDAKNRMDMYKESDKAATILRKAVPPQYCEIKESKELGYFIDVNTGENAFVTGDYGFIKGELFTKQMIKGHTYIIIHTHAKDWYICRGSGTITIDTFSLADLGFASNLTEQGYHVQKMIVLSDNTYEVYPKTTDNWKTNEEVYKAVEQIEKTMEVSFHIDYTDPYTGKTTKYYNLVNIMPLLAEKLNYTYAVNYVVMYQP